MTPVHVVCPGEPRLSRRQADRFITKFRRTRCHADGRRISRAAATAVFIRLVHNLAAS